MSKDCYKSLIKKKKIDANNVLEGYAFWYNIDLNRFEKRLKDGKWQAISEEETDEKGIPLLSAFREASEKRAKETGTGSTTLARAVLVQSINKRMVQGEGQKGWDEVLDGSSGISSSTELDKTAGRNIQIENTPLYQILYQSATKKV